MSQIALGGFVVVNNMLDGDLTYHDLRHDAASTMVQAGIPLWSVAQVLGHRDVRMTARYAHLAPGHLQDALHALERKA